MRTSLGVLLLAVAAAGQFMTKQTETETEMETEMIQANQTEMIQTDQTENTECWSIGCWGPTVSTAQGYVRGRSARSSGRHVYYSFKGIPYAEPPTGALRFQPPRRHARWRGIRNAAEHRSTCAQFNFLKETKREGSEDCLFANVYTRRLPRRGRSDTGLLPVMVYVHGGGFFFGSGDSDFHGPTYLMDEQVVLVTFNYRVGVFGFMTTDDAAAPGNYGLLDQVMLLQWVQDNIASFGGDPRSVTIFGESAGSASVSLLVLSPLARGLFHRAISQSGASFSSFAACGRKTNTARRFADYLNCGSDDTALMVDCLRSASEDQLMQATLALEAFYDTFLPRVDAEAEVPFLPEDPRVILESGKFSLVPWMSGLTEEEGYFYLPLVLYMMDIGEALLAGDRAAWGEITGLITEEPWKRARVDCGADRNELLDKVMKHYAIDGIYTAESVAHVISDRMLISSGSEQIRLAAAHAPVYKYLLDHRGPGRQRYTVLQNAPLPDLGVTHTDDLLYLFSGIDRPQVKPGTDEYTMIRFMVNLWANFARTGRPSSDVIAMPDWPIFTEQSQRHMRLNSEPAVDQRLFEERVNFWQQIAINEPYRHPLETECGEDN